MGLIVLKVEKAFILTLNLALPRAYAFSVAQEAIV